MTNTLKLVPKTVEEARAMIEAMDPRDRANVSPEWLERISSPSGVDQWTLGCTLVRVADGAKVGHGGFRSAPKQGVVEIAYGVGPQHEGRGYATEAARALADIAFACDEVHLVIAHTFDRANASARVLTKAGFACAGQVIDPEDGAVWRWEKKREKT